MNIDKLKRLYSLCFKEDTPSMTDLFFAKRVREDNTLYIEEDGEIVCALYIVEKTMRYKGVAVRMPYIVGLGTHPSFRNKGLAKTLLLRAFEFLKDEPFIALYPFDHAFYEKFGFTTVSFDRESVRNGGFILNEAEIKSVYKKYIKNLDYYIDRSDGDFSYLYRYNLTANDPYKTFETGYANGDEVIVPNASEGEFKGVMARIVNLEKALSLTNATTCLGIKVKDTSIKSNNKTFSLRDGKIIKSAQIDREVDIAELTKALFGKSAQLKSVFPPMRGHLADRY